MNIVWIVLGIAALGAIATKLALRPSRGGSPPDLGSVSQHWLTEQRFDHTHDARR